MTDLVGFLVGYVVTRELIRRGSYLGPVLGVAGVCYLVMRAGAADPEVAAAALRLVGRRPGQDMRPVVLDEWRP